MMPLPALLPVSEIQERLRVIFPQGTPNRNYVTREIAAKTIFVLLYIGAIDGTERWLRPDQVTRMTDAQATLTDDEARESWLEASLQPATGSIADRDNTAFKSSVSELAWKSFAWFASEPEHIIMLHRGANAEQVHLSDLMRS